MEILEQVPVEEIEEVTTTEIEIDDKTIDMVLNTAKLQELIQKLVSDGISAKLAGKTPQKNITDVSAVERAEFKNSSYKERLKIYETDLSKYNKLKGAI